MADINETLTKLGDVAGKFANMPPLEFAPYSIVNNIVSKPPVIEIDEESTFAYQMKQQTKQIIEKSNEQIALLEKQNEQLSDNYKKLEDLYKIKEQEATDAKKEAKTAKRYNALMLILTIISMLVAIGSWFLPNILEGAT